MAKIKVVIAKCWEVFYFFLAGNISFFQMLAAFRPASMTTPEPSAVTLFQRPFRIPTSDVGDFTGMAWQIIHKNQYHVELMKDGAAVVDAGANMGIFSILAAHRYPNATVYAFEPSPQNFRILKENTVFYPNIKVFNVALGDSEGMTNIVECGGSGTSSYVGDKGIPVEMKTIDGLNIPVNFLKMDVEGSEGDILKGATETIKKYRPIIAMSAYHKPDDPTELPKLLNSIAPYDCELRHDCEEDLICKPKKQ